MGCQKAIAAKIVAQECDYALGQRTTGRRWRRRSRASSTRRCVVTDGLGCLGDGHGWPGAKALVMVESIREAGGVAGTEQRYYISSRLDGAERMGAVVRGHWGVEDGLHWSLDVAFGEDQARMREGNPAENFSILRRVCLNLIRLDKSVKAGVKNKRLLACCDDAYRQKLLGIQAVA